VKPKTKQDWQRLRNAADTHCQAAWPKLQKMRSRLREAEDAYYRYQALVIEADRHLVSITEVPKTASGRTKPSDATWTKWIKQMSKKERRSLAMKLQNEVTL